MKYKNTVIFKIGISLMCCVGCFLNEDENTKYDYPIIAENDVKIHLEGEGNKYVLPIRVSFDSLRIAIRNSKVYKKQELYNNLIIGIDDFSSQLFDSLQTIPNLIDCKITIKNNEETRIHFFNENFEKYHVIKEIYNVNLKYPEYFFTRRKIKRGYCKLYKINGRVEKPVFFVMEEREIENGLTIQILAFQKAEDMTGYSEVKK